MADILTPADLLPAFMREAAAAPFAFGEWDCCMMLANWVRMARGGQDPAAAIRGTYSGDLGWGAIVEAAGGMVPLVAGIAERAGMGKVHPDDAMAGDVAVVKIGGNDFELGGICLGPDRWAVKLQRGVQQLPRTRALAAWRL